jgi:hypothetical protein
MVNNEEIEKQLASLLETNSNTNFGMSVDNPSEKPTDNTSATFMEIANEDEDEYPTYR